jgi:hypothetical protein
VHDAVLTTGPPEARGVRILTEMVWAPIAAGLGWAVFVASLAAYT